ncbi:hypothetical protein [Halobaculum marinum]|uniref:Uncharacterized protein n=1 Tax=Halobaculum marinum TaxID=3031996 RepID=A0ABD5X129_9EURY|nr:hypothetical protein [Halobaculum sp. DT55]
MRIRIGGEVHHGDAVDLRGVDADATAVRETLDLAADDPLATVSATPPALSVALAAAARERGHDHPNDAEIERLRAALATTEPPDSSDPAVDLATARRRAAEAGSDVARLRERVATLRGRLRERRGGDAEPGTSAGEAESLAEVESAFEAATRALTEAETERVAARQALSRATERARRARDASERERSRRDALANRRREARAALARELWDEFWTAFDAVAADAPATDHVGDDPTAFDGDPVAGHAAAVRLARRDDPVVVSAPLFDDEAAATVRDRLRAPVVLVSAP